MAIAGTKSVCPKNNENAYDAFGSILLARLFILAFSAPSVLTSYYRLELTDALSSRVLPVEPRRYILIVFNSPVRHLRDRLSKFAMEDHVAYFHAVSVSSKRTLDLSAASFACAPTVSAVAISWTPFMPENLVQRTCS
jgi:hypothetical protein